MKTMMASECHCLIDIEKCGLVSVIIVALSFNQYRYTVYFMDLASKHIHVPYGSTIPLDTELAYCSSVRIISAETADVDGT